MEKKYFNVTYRVSEDVWSANLAHAENADDVRVFYERDSHVSGGDIIIADADDYAVEDAQRRHKPIVEIDHVEPVADTIAAAMEPGFADHAELEEIAPRLHVSARNSKLGRIPNMSLTPGRTCSPEACAHCLKEGCYARASYDRWQNVRTAWDDNTWLAVHDLPAMETGFSALFGNKMTAPRFFRVHVGGDFVSREYAEMWARIAARAPWTLFLAFTKQFDFVRDVDFPANFTLILSDWPGMEIPADLREKYHVAWLDDGTRPADVFPADALECPGHCDTCGACWQCNRDTIFHKH